jgi:hypothetical protein
MEGHGQMPQFQIEGDAEVFDNAETISFRGEISRYSFVTAEQGDDTEIVLTPVELKDLPDFEGLLFQVDVDDAEDVVILRQVQMFFWPWDDDEEFDESDSPDDEGQIA